MKRLTILTAFTLFICISAFAQKDVKQVSNNNSNQPYKVGATNVSIGNSALSQKVLWLWKYYDDNTLDKGDALIADDILATLPDGTVIKGKEIFYTE